MNISFDGKLYDGESSTSHPVQVFVDDNGRLSVEGFAIDPVFFGDLQVSARIGNTSRYLDFDNGIRIETTANNALDQLIGQWHSGRPSMAHLLESNLRIVALAIVVLVLSGLLLVQFGIPKMSGYITALLPTSVDDQLGEQVLERLDSFIFEPTELSANRQQELRDYFDTLLPASERQYRLHFRNSETMGANAFALPNADIVFTDQLVDLASDTEMLGPIMLHEIGHVRNRLTMQAVVSQTGVSMLVFALSGDIGSAATSLLASIPGFLVQSSYSRELEWEADGYALDEMIARGMDPESFADIMERILESDTASTEDDDSGENTAESGNGFSQYFSSHPPTAERVVRFRSAVDQ